MTLSQKEILRVAQLSQLELSDAELALYDTHINNILKLVDQMNQIDTADIAPMTHPFDHFQALRADTITVDPTLENRHRLLEIAPSKEFDIYLVPKVIEE